jgi:hypothetical protein
MKPYLSAAALLTVAFVFAAQASADIPAGYLGTPYKGTPWPLPGRIDFENFDLGGYNVGFKTEHHLAGAPIGCSGGDYRTDADQPTMCKTNQGTEVDKYADGTLYPSAQNPVSYYIGAVRPSDWIQLTVNVKTAGTYKLSSTLASDADKIDLTLQFNGVEKLHFQTPAGGGYHQWVPAPLFAEVQLEAGVQVLRLVCNREHVNADYIQFSLVTPGGLDDGSVGGAGAGSGGVSGTAGGGAGGASGGSGPSGGAAGSTDSSAGSTSVAGASAAGANAAGASAAGASSTAGASGQSSSTAGAPSGITPVGNASGTDSGCACKIGAPSPSRSLQGVLLTALASALYLTRGRRRRTRR